MIVTEERLKMIFSQIPAIQVNSNYSIKPFFSWGRKDALNDYIERSNSKNYPLIWLLPSVDNYNYSSNTSTRQLSLVIATLETRLELSNEQRYKGSYLSTLNPLTDYVIQALRNSSVTRIISTEISVLKEPNYTDKKDNEKERGGTIDRWDAVRLDLEVEFNNNCIKPIRWR